MYPRLARLKLFHVPGCTHGQESRAKTVLAAAAHRGNARSSEPDVCYFVSRPPSNVIECVYNCVSCSKRARKEGRLNFCGGSAHDFSLTSQCPYLHGGRGTHWDGALVNMGVRFCHVKIPPSLVCVAASYETSRTAQYFHTSKTQG